MTQQSRIDLVKEQYGIRELEDWSRIDPEAVLAVANVGPRTLDEIRIYLAARGLTLRHDQTPAFWQSNLTTAKVGATMATQDVARSCPFTILVDSGEQIPWSFRGMIDDGAPLIVPFVRQSLGATWGDYSIRNYQGQIHIERKSIDDCVGTILGFGGQGERRERFLATLERLSSIPYGWVIVEGTVGACLGAIKGNHKRPRDVRQRAFFRQLLAMRQDFSVPWLFADSRRMAEVAAFRVLQRAWRKSNTLAEAGSPDVGDL